VGADESGENVEDGRADGASGKRGVAGAKRAHAPDVATAVVVVAAGVRVGITAEADSVTFYVPYIYIYVKNRLRTSWSNHIHEREVGEFGGVRYGTQCYQY